MQPQPVMVVQPMYRQYADPCLRQALMIWTGIDMVFCLLSGIGAANQGVYYAQAASFSGFLGFLRAILGFVGAYQENVCMLAGYWIWGILYIVGCLIAIGLLSYGIVFINDPPEGPYGTRVFYLSEEATRVMTIVLIMVIVVYCICVIAAAIQIHLARKLIEAIKRRDAGVVQPVALPPA